ncbi:hypothetical protein [Paenibacillus lignilyticus]|uniref:Galactose mutarotase n=1 Tax=Paenibacillus lignilyticus TaxID=1172615 RepID=A0ABS5CJ49_9BACL|nr:hypothetical protein [Paenibacillus lignilyticus]MBP3965894.1 hypothetical protein [Paenibacillus lignilyticus]
MPIRGAQIYESSYRGCLSLVAENESVRVETIPELGGKIVSLLYKPTGKEWLLDAGDRPMQKLDYGSNFCDGDMSGWDECFPTIDACSAGEDGSLNLPDHGEVWALPWQAEVSGDALGCTVEGRQLPYRLTRTLSLPGERRLRLNYTVQHLGGAPFSFLWVAHPQFAVDEPTRILTPPSVREMNCIYGKADRDFMIPDVWAYGPETTGEGTKFYYNGAVPEGWSGLLGMNSHAYMIVSVPKDTVPHFGVWIDQGKFNDRTTIALEPGIGYYDSLERAERNGTSVRLREGESYSWSVDILLGHGDWRE